MIEVRPIHPTRKALRDYVQFGIDLYKDNPCFIPPVAFEEAETLMPGKNPAFDFCRAQAFMAYRDGKPAGRIAALVNDVVNQRTGRREARFGFVDFVDDDEVVDALFHAAEDWARQQGMEEIIGPMGFTDMDHEGMLVDGFDEMGTMSTIYNYPYYVTQMERMGYAKDQDWIEFRVTVPPTLPEKMKRVAEMVMKRYNLKIVKAKNPAWARKKYGDALFSLINEAYDKLYGYSPLSDRQKKYYVDMYLQILRMEYLTIVTDADDQMVGVGIAIPSLSQALRRSGGKLFPMGWLHMLRALHSKQHDVVDLLLIAVKPEYLAKGVNSLMFYDLLPRFVKNGAKFAETNLELEDNANVQRQWDYFETRQHRRRRAWRKKL